MYNDDYGTGAVYELRNTNPAGPKVVEFGVLQLESQNRSVRAVDLGRFVCSVQRKRAILMISVN